MAGILILEWMGFRLPSLCLFLVSSFFFLTYYLPYTYSFFSFNNTPFWRRFIATSLRGLSAYIVTGHIHLLFCHCHLFMFVLCFTHLTHLSPVIYHLSLSSLYHFDSDTISRAAGGRRAFLFSDITTINQADPGYMYWSSCLYA